MRLKGLLVAVAMTAVVLLALGAGAQAGNYYDQPQQGAAQGGGSQQMAPQAAPPQPAPLTGQGAGSGKARIIQGPAGAGGYTVRLFSGDSLIGMDIKNYQNEDIGQVNDVILTPAGNQVAFIVAEYGGVAGIGAKLVPVPWQAVQFAPNADNLLFNMDKQRLDAAPSFSDDNWPNFTDTNYINQIHQYYGVRPPAMASRGGQAPGRSGSQQGGWQQPPAQQPQGGWQQGAAQQPQGGWQQPPAQQPQGAWQQQGGWQQQAPPQQQQGGWQQGAAQQQQGWQQDPNVPSQPDSWQAGGGRGMWQDPSGDWRNAPQYQQPGAGWTPQQSALWNVRLSSILGSDVKNPSGDELGNLQDVFIDLNAGQLAYAIIGFGGFLGIGENTSAVPWNALAFNAQDRYASLQTDLATLRQLALDRSQFPQLAHPQYAMRLHSFFNQSPYWTTGPAGERQALAGAQGAQGTQGQRPQSRQPRGQAQQ